MKALLTMRPRVNGAASMLKNQTKNSLALLVGGVLGLGALATPSLAGEDVALAIVFDTSGSMGETVKDKAGRFSPKDTIARRALDFLVARLSRDDAVESGPPIRN